MSDKKLEAAGTAAVAEQGAPSDKHLRVSRSSWHYRLYAKSFVLDGNVPEPRTLCGYFWMVVLAPTSIFWGYFVKWTVVAFVERVVRLGNIAASIVFTSIGASSLTAWAFLNWQSFVISLGIVAAVIVGVFLIATGCLLYEHFHGDKPDRESTAGFLLWATVKAKKRKVCPLVEVVE